MKPTVVIVCGGRGGEHQVSLRSAQGIYQAIDRNHYKPLLAAISRQGDWFLGTPETLLDQPDDPAAIAIKSGLQPVFPVSLNGACQLVTMPGGKSAAQVSLFFPIVHGTDGEDGALQGMFRLLGVPFVGPDVLGSALGMDKALAKTVLKAAGLPVARWATFRSLEAASQNFDQLADDFGLPLYVKPASQGSSVGVSKAHDRPSYQAALQEAFRYDQKVLVEEQVAGREIECAVMGGQGGPDNPSGLGAGGSGSPHMGHGPTQASIPGEIVAKDGFYSYQAKYLDPQGARLEIPAPLDPTHLQQMQELAIQVFEALECYGLGRVDCFFTPDCRFVVNEINTLPGFTPISMYPKLWEASGLPYGQLLTRLMELALHRHRQRQLLEG